MAGEAWAVERGLSQSIGGEFVLEGRQSPGVVREGDEKFFVIAVGVGD